MISQEIKDKIAKVYELVKRGATEGEKEAAQNALDKLIEKYQLDGIDLESINKEKRQFKYSTSMELTLLAAIIRVLIEDKNAISYAVRNTYKVRNVEVPLTYIDYVTVDCAYEYFRRHMKQQWNKTFAKYLKQCRKPKTKNKKRTALQDVFMSRYIVKSNLYREGDTEMRTTDLSKLSPKQLEEFIALQEIEGGQFNRQMTNGLLLENK